MSDRFTTLHVGASFAAEARVGDTYTTYFATGPYFTERRMGLIKSVNLWAREVCIEWMTPDEMAVADVLES